MSGRRDIKLKLDAYLNGVTGQGEELTFQVDAWRTTKAGTHESYKLELKVCRFGVTRILQELQKMHARDRERLQRELERIRKETVLLTQDPPA